jgi:hypothetical protein
MVIAYYLRQQTLSAALLHVRIFHNGKFRGLFRPIFKIGPFLSMIAASAKWPP